MAKFVGKGAKFLVKGSGATPTYVEVGQVQEIGNIDITADEVEVTTLDAGVYRQYIQGFKDPGECQLTVIYDPALATHDDSADGLFGMFTAGDVRDCAIRMNSSDTGGDAYLTFQAFLRDWSFGALNADDAQTAKPTWRITGPITLSNTAPTAFAGPEGDKHKALDAARRAYEKAQREAGVAAESELPLAA